MVGMHQKYAIATLEASEYETPDQLLERTNATNTDSSLAGITMRHQIEIPGSLFDCSHEARCLTE